MTKGPAGLFLALATAAAVAIAHCGSSPASSGSATSATGTAKATTATTVATTTATATGTASATATATASATATTTTTATVTATTTATGTATGPSNIFPTSTAFTVTTPGFAYSIANGAGTTLAGANPGLLLTHGQIYTFHVNASTIHPFVITSDIGGTVPYPGATNNNVATGDVVLTLPASGAPQTLYYRCSVHQFGGALTIQ